MVPVIIVPVLNRYDLLDRCLQSIDYPVETLIVIDNGGQSTLHDWPWVIDRRHVKNYHVWSMPTRLQRSGCSASVMFPPTLRITILRNGQRESTYSSGLLMLG